MSEVGVLLTELGYEGATGVAAIMAKAGFNDRHFVVALTKSMDPTFDIVMNYKGLAAFGSVHPRRAGRSIRVQAAMEEAVNRQVFLTNFGESEHAYDQTTVSTIQIERRFTDPTNLQQVVEFHEFETMTFWENSPLNFTYTTTHTEAEAIEAHAKHCAEVEDALLALVSGY